MGTQYLKKRITPRQIYLPLYTYPRTYILKLKILIVGCAKGCTAIQSQSEAHR